MNFWETMDGLSAQQLDLSGRRYHLPPAPGMWQSCRCGEPQRAPRWSRVKRSIRTYWKAFFPW